MSRHLRPAGVAFVSAIVIPSSIGGHHKVSIVCNRAIVAFMSFLTTLVQGVHIVIGITPPPPEQTNRYVIIWALALVGSAAIIAGFGYFLMGVVFATR